MSKPTGPRGGTTTRTRYGARVTVYMTDELHRFLKVLAAQTNTSMSMLVERALRRAYDLEPLEEKGGMGGGGS